MNKQATTAMMVRLMEAVGLEPWDRPTLRRVDVEAIVVPKDKFLLHNRELTVEVCDRFAGYQRDLGYVDRIVIRTDRMGVSKYFSRQRARTFMARKDRTFNELGIIKGLRELAQAMRDDAAVKRKHALADVNEKIAKNLVCSHLSAAGVDMNPDCHSGEADTRFGTVKVVVRGEDVIKLEMPDFETAAQVAAFLELIR